MKTPSLSEVAFHVEQIREDHSPRFIAVITNGDVPKYGHGRTSFGAIVDALGDTAAHALVADMASDAGSYFFDENFGRDAARLVNQRGDVLAIMIRG